MGSSVSIYSLVANVLVIKMCTHCSDCTVIPAIFNSLGILVKKDQSHLHYILLSVYTNLRVNYLPRPSLVDNCLYLTSSPSPQH